MILLFLLLIFVIVIIIVLCKPKKEKWNMFTCNHPNIATLGKGEGPLYVPQGNLTDDIKSPANKLNINNMGDQVLVVAKQVTSIEIYPSGRFTNELDWEFNFDLLNPVKGKESLYFELTVVDYYTYYNIDNIGDALTCLLSVISLAKLILCFSFALTETIFGTAIATIKASIVALQDLVNGLCKGICGAVDGVVWIVTLGQKTIDCGACDTALPTSNVWDTFKDTFLDIYKDVWDSDGQFMECMKSFFWNTGNGIPCGVNHYYTVDMRPSFAVPNGVDLFGWANSLTEDEEAQGDSSMFAPNMTHYITKNQKMIDECTEYTYNVGGCIVPNYLDIADKSMLPCDYYYCQDTFCPKFYRDVQQHYDDLYLPGSCEIDGGGPVPVTKCGKYNFDCIIKKIKIPDAKTGSILTVGKYNSVTKTTDYPRVYLQGPLILDKAHADVIASSDTPNGRSELHPIDGFAWCYVEDPVNGYNMSTNNTSPIRIITSSQPNKMSEINENTDWPKSKLTWRVSCFTNSTEHRVGECNYVNRKRTTVWLLSLPADIYTNKGNTLNYSPSGKIKITKKICDLYNNPASGNNQKYNLDSGDIDNIKEQPNINQDTVATNDTVIRDISEFYKDGDMYKFYFQIDMNLPNSFGARYVVDYTFEVLYELNIKDCGCTCGDCHHGTCIQKKFLNGQDCSCFCQCDPYYSGSDCSIQNDNSCDNNSKCISGYVCEKNTCQQYVKNPLPAYETKCEKNYGGCIGTSNDYKGTCVNNKCVCNYDVECPSGKCESGVCICGRHDDCYTGYSCSDGKCVIKESFPINRDQTERTQPNRTRPNRTQPNRTRPNRTQPNRTQPNRTQPNRNPNFTGEKIPSPQEILDNIRKRRAEKKNFSDESFTLDKEDSLRMFNKVFEYMNLANNNIKYLEVSKGQENEIKSAIEFVALSLRLVLPEKKTEIYRWKDSILSKPVRIVDRPKSLKDIINMNLPREYSSSLKSMINTNASQINLQNFKPPAYIKK